VLPWCYQRKRIQENRVWCYPIVLLALAKQTKMEAATISVDCPSCKEKHDLLLVGASMSHVLKRYEYICPKTGAVVPLVSGQFWQTVQARPKGAIDVREVI
jgi:hypothetical protein